MRRPCCFVVENVMGLMPYVNSLRTHMYIVSWYLFFTYFYFCASNLRWNKLQDVIPPEIGELKSLTHL